jgi:hypothetical protein
MGLHWTTWCLIGQVLAGLALTGACLAGAFSMGPGVSSPRLSPWSSVAAALLLSWPLWLSAGEVAQALRRLGRN